jgi:UDP-N-acetylglucosamine--N-acetylmuramyl-(pentapeptide) pyrophosphoryl-undecaprenol N-acetylglucosamine transferase
MQNLPYQNQKNNNCFYICGLTGGPFFPIPAIIEQVETNIPNTKPILIGVQNSYESKIAGQFDYNIEYLPKAKLDLLSFKNQSFLEFIQGVLKSIWSILLLIFSFAKCVFLLIKYHPILIYSTGSFLAVPMLWAAKLTNVMKITKAKIIVHQQDATIGLANKLTANLADLKSCVFQYTKNKYPQFQNAELIPNPIIISKYNANNTWQDKNLEAFVKDKTTKKTLLLIFGGGSGALAINKWVNENIIKLTAKFRIIHLTGILQKEKLQKSKANVGNSPLEMTGTARLDPAMHSPKGWQPQVDGVDKSDDNIFKNKIKQNPAYHAQPSVLQDMPVLLSKVDLVICRAGLGSISELSFLNKPTFLVPLPYSHQEQNAELITQKNSKFKVLNQVDQNIWLNTIQNTKFYFSDSAFNQHSLDNYYTKIANLINSILT